MLYRDSKGGEVIQCVLHVNARVKPSSKGRNVILDKLTLQAEPGDKCGARHTSSRRVTAV